ncbi:hypothetical protein HDV05_004243 [Chytridiales sp. JEL 0842]|nr:hypothetical protein HDV05_004243 [Chytridiales sp. JEL 0842]
MVSSFLSTALYAGEAALMLSSTRNIHNVQILLEANGINVTWAIKSGQLSMIDGYTHLSALTATGHISQEVFTALFASTIVDLLSQWPQVCFYGDLVSGMMLQSLQPNSTPLFGDLAIELETMYHKFQADKPNLITLCGYWVEAFTSGDFELDAQVVERFRQVCQCHHHAGTEEIPTWDEENKVLSTNVFVKMEPPTTDTLDGITEDFASMNTSEAVMKRKKQEQSTLEAYLKQQALKKKNLAKSQPVLSRLKNMKKRITHTHSTVGSAPVIHVDVGSSTGSTGADIQKCISSPTDPIRLISVLEQRAESLQAELNAFKMKEATFTEAMSTLARSASESLKRERDVHNQILSVLPVGVLCAESWREQQMYVNKTFCKMVGCLEQDVMSGDWLEVIHPEDRGKVQKLLIDMGSVHNKDLEPVKLEYRIRSSKSAHEPAHPADSGAATKTNDVESPQIRQEEADLVWVASETLKCNIQGRWVFVHAIVDTTELKRVNAERTLISAREAYQIQKAVDADKRRLLLDEFIDSLCHELRNPLNGIVGNLDVIQSSMEERKQLLDRIKERYDICPTASFDDAETISISKREFRNLYNQIPDEEESIATINTCAIHSRVLADDVLALSKLDSKKMSLRNASFCPKTLLGEVANIMGPKASAKGLDVRFNMPFNITPFIADSFRIRQVIINLFSNAVVYTEQGSITLSLEYVKLPGPPSENLTRPPKKSKEKDTSLQNYLRISVTDTGVGMTPSERQQLFQKFSQPTAAVSREQQYGGTGLGLVISKKLVELMGGWIEIESVKGVGSKFSFTIKEGSLAKADEGGLGEVTGAAAVKEGGVGGSGERGTNAVESSKVSQKLPQKMAQSVLIVDDNAINRKVMERILKQCKIPRISTATNGLEAVNLIQSPDHDIDLVFMDINMPIMDGLKATEEIRKLEHLRSLGDRISTASSPSSASSASSNGLSSSTETLIDETGDVSPASTESSLSTDYQGSKQSSDFKRLTIIGISGNAREQSIQTALGKGMDGYITKPWTKEDVYKAVGYIPVEKV